MQRHRTGDARRAVGRVLVIVGLLVIAGFGVLILLRTIFRGIPRIRTELEDRTGFAFRGVLFKALAPRGRLGRTARGAIVVGRGQQSLLVRVPGRNSLDRGHRRGGKDKLGRLDRQEPRGLRQVDEPAAGAEGLGADQARRFAGSRSAKQRKNVGGGDFGDLRLRLRLLGRRLRRLSRRSRSAPAREHAFQVESQASKNAAEDVDFAGRLLRGEDIGVGAGVGGFGLGRLDGDDHAETLPISAGTGCIIGSASADGRGLRISLFGPKPVIRPFWITAT